MLGTAKKSAWTARLETLDVLSSFSKKIQQTKGNYSQTLFFPQAFSRQNFWPITEGAGCPSSIVDFD